jgi:hypothetical protein
VFPFFWVSGSSAATHPSGLRLECLQAGQDLSGTTQSDIDARDRRLHLVIVIGLISQTPQAKQQLGNFPVSPVRPTAVM